MSWLSSLFGGGKNPADAAKPYLDKIPGVGHNAYDPYIEQGRGASERLGGEYDKLLSDPTAFINKLMEGYKPSEGYQYAKDQLGKSMSATSAAGGIAGTPLDQQQQAEGVNGLLSQDMQQFLQNVLGRYDTGLAGEEGIANKGFGASGSLADLLGGALNQQAGLAFQGQAQQNKNKTDLFSGLAKALGIGASAATGGTSGTSWGWGGI